MDEVVGVFSDLDSGELLVFLAPAGPGSRNICPANYLKGSGIYILLRSAPSPPAGLTCVQLSPAKVTTLLDAAKLVPKPG